MARKSDKTRPQNAKKQLAEMLVDFFNRHEGEVLTLRKIFDDLNIRSTSLKQQCTRLLDDLVFEGLIIQPAMHNYKLAQQSSTFNGTFKRNNNGSSLFYPEDESEPITIAERNSAHALTDDYVKVVLFARRRGRGREGEVIEIIRRVNDTFVGELQVEKHYAFLLTESRHLAHDIFIPRDQLKGGKTGDKAVVKLVEWPSDSKNPIGKVIDVLGKSGENDVEMNAILAEFGLPYKYPEAVDLAAKNLSTDITPEEIARRDDFRNITTFTIDPDDAKDFDDALSIRPISNDLWEVGVHIADVSHYVNEGGIIDKEAYKRATSIYLVDRTIPMLPEHLCNFLCSLRPDEDKLTYAVIFTLNDKGDIKNSRIAHTIIRSNRRFTYDQVQETLKNGEGEFGEELLQLNKMARAMREKRFAAGAIDFQQAEVRFRIDETGKPISVFFNESNESHQLIEEFMLAANRAVAEAIGKKGSHGAPKTFVYRIHDQPDPQKIDTLVKFIAKLGYKMRSMSGKNSSATALNNLLNEVKGKQEQNIIETISLRTMQKAKYSTHNIGHFGLAFRHYTHFTSPIRRYPDLMVHRLLDRYIFAGGRSVNSNKFEEFCEHCSAQEQLATSAERASIKYKQVEFLSEHINEEFDATISGVTEWGIYAEIVENKCEGMIPIRTLGDDYYEYDDKNYCLVGRRRHRKYTIGDPVKIKIMRANLERKQLDFELVE